MTNENPPVRITAFVGRSFLPQDKEVWHEIRAILESLRPVGFVFEDAKEAQLRPISEKVRQGIERNDMYVGILTRRFTLQVYQPEASMIARILATIRRPNVTLRWSTSEWVVQETGFALGRGKRVLLLIEEGVEFPSSDLAADTEWISFNRESISECATSLTAMIGNLIAEKLPAIPPTVQVAPPEEPTPAEEEVTGFDQVIALCNQKEFMKADERFEVFLAEQPVTIREWLSVVYLRLKSVKGDAGSLQKLRGIVEREPQNVEARIELARYHRTFKAYDEAARILLEGADIVSKDFKPKLLRLAAEELIAEKQYKRAIKTIANLLSTLADPEEIRLAFLSLADIAKSENNQELEASALERALNVDPADSDVRFRLAYLYSEMGNNRLAVHHYKLRLAQGPDPIVLNNLGVAFSALKMKGKEIEMYAAASDDSRLARANLSHAYVDRGFLLKAEELAAEVAKSEDETERKSATSALNRITAMRSTESENEEKILIEVKTEGAFRSRYAEAYVAAAGSPISGAFETPYGRMSFHQEGEMLRGAGSFTEQVGAGLGLLNPFARAHPGSARAISKTLDFEAKMVGRSGKFRLRIEEQGKVTSFLLPESSTVEGLLILAQDGESLEVLEQEEHRAKIYRAKKVLSNDKVGG